MLNVLKSHAGAVAALLCSILLATVLIGCQVTAPSIEKVGVEVTQDTLNQEIARAQARLDKEAADVKSATAAAQAAVDSANSKYMADAKQSQAQIDASQAAIQRKVDERRQVLSIIPSAVMTVAGQVASGHIDPMSLGGSLLMSLLPVIGVGATVDSVRARLQVASLTKPWDGTDRRGDTPAVGNPASASAAAPPPAKLAA